MSPFMQDGESTHIYKGRGFVVDVYTRTFRGKVINVTWQCSDQGHIVRGRGVTKAEAIAEAHLEWDDWLESERSNN